MSGTQPDTCTNALLNILQLEDTWKTMAIEVRFEGQTSLF